MNHSILDAVSIFTAVVFVCVVLLLSIVIWSIRRHRDPKLHIECDSPIDELIPSLAGLTLSTAVAGNSVEVLENGAFFEVLLQRIRSAQQSVHFETFLWKEGVLGQRVADALSERARAGKQVRVLLDATGSKEVGKAARRQMEEAGCRVVLFHEKAFRNIGVLNDRDHRKLVVIDGREAFVGGHCIVDSWLGDAQDSEHFGDISLRLRGPIVNSVQSAVQRELGWGNGGVVRRRRCISDPGTRRRRVDPRGVRKAGRLGACREDSSPHGHMPRPQANLDSESLFHSRAGSDRRVRRSRFSRRRCARDDAFDWGVR
jgi:phosphatidylserine/phosphatidylglycerophosphate/cardiolipin synthase-like enzyme